MMRDMQTVTEIRALLHDRGMQPRKRFGQNFLVDAGKRRRILDAAGIEPHDLVLEVGPGTGGLTEGLLEAGAHVVAVEIDRDLCDILRQRLGGHARFTLIEGDALAGKHALSDEVVSALGLIGPASDHGRHATAPRFTLVANLPYNIASPLLVTLAGSYPAMRRAVVMVQKEVAGRMLAEPGGKAYGPLTVMLQATCAVTRIDTLGPGSFWPPPRVDSVVVQLTRRDQPLTDDLSALADLTQRLFQQRRKQIGTILGREHDWPQPITPEQRPEQLTVAQLIQLAERLARG